VFTPFHKLPYTYPYGRSVDETTTVMSDLNVLRLVVLNRIMSNLDGTLIVTQEWNLVTMNSIVLQCLPHPKELSITTRHGHILGFGGGERHTIPLLGKPTNQGPTKKLASPRS
jgi:hypothetical protein